MHARKQNLIFREWRRGSAALEVLMLIPFIVLIFMLLFNMAYNAERHRKTQAAARLAAYSYVINMAKMDKGPARDAAESDAHKYIFSNEPRNTVDIQFSNGQQIPADLKGFDNKLGLLGNASNRIILQIKTRRTPPYADLFPNTRLEGYLTFAANTWTYCEMKDSDHGGGVGDIVGDFDNLVGDYALWLFGGCGGGIKDGCPDECQ
jgi:hypothetical protein